MKAWAEEFYHSDAWHKCREAYLQSVGYLCERCIKENKLVPAKLVHHREYLTEDNIHDLSITLCRENLEALCQDCHNKEHHAAERRQRYTFDDRGQVLPATPPGQTP